MTRKAVLGVLTPQGGIVQYARQTFVSWDCQYFKIDVEFESFGRRDTDRDGRSLIVESDHDRVIGVSRPYLGWLIVD